MAPKPRTRPPSRNAEAVAHQEAAAAEYAEIPLAWLALNEENARRFKENMTPQRQARFWELVASVREHGILEPLLVRPVAAKSYAIIAGERRFRAASHVAEELGIQPADYQVPCMIREVGDEEAFDLMVIENMLREDLTPFEAAQAFRAYLERHGNTPDAAAELAARTGLPVHAIRRQVRLLQLPAEVLAALKDGHLTQSHAELFTRVGDAEQVTELLAACLRSKLSTRELAERIGAASPDLERGFFDKGDCQLCHFNTSVQSGLFADATPAGKCGNPGCFEGKQGEFLTANWLQSKAAEKFGTRSFRFSHRLTAEHREPLPGQEPAGRCLACDCFVSLLRLTGAVIGGYERTCVGPLACFEEFYRAPALPPAVPVAAPPADEAQIVDVNGCGQGREACPADGSTCTDCLDAADPPAGEGDALAAMAKRYEGVDYSPAAPGLGAALAAAREKHTPKKEKTAQEVLDEATGPVFDAARGERARQAFIKEVLPDIVNGFPAGPLSPVALRMVLTALALSSSAVKTHLVSGMGLQTNIKPDQLAAKIFEIPAGGAATEMVAGALALILNDFTLMPAVRQLVAEKFGVDLASEWRLTETYLQSLTKSEIVRIGEEPGVNIWEDEKVRAWRREHHKGKALRALSKSELIDMILKSGAELQGRVPAEVLGRRLK